MSKKVTPQGLTPRSLSIVRKRGSLAQRFPLLCSEWDTDKNQPLAPEIVSPFSNSKAWWKCSAGGHAYQSVIAARARGAGCPYCSGRLVSSKDSLAALFPELVVEWDHSQNGGLDPKFVAPSSDKIVWWKCRTCGHSWRCRAANRTGQNKSGCPSCAERRRSQAKTQRGLARSGSLADKFPETAREWHYGRNAPIAPDGISPKSGRSVWWKCIRGHEWKVRVISRTQRGGTGCPFCSNQTSRLELRLLCEFRTVFDEVLWRSKINKREVDLCIPCCRLAIEVDGYPWHRDKEARDLAKQHKVPDWRWMRIRDVRLAAIGKEDVQFTDKEQHLEIVCRTLKRIFDTLPLNKVQSSKIHAYLESKSFLAEAEYAAALAALPGPLPGQSFADHHQALVTEWHPSKNGDLTPYMVHPSSSLKVWWMCHEGHEWQSVVGNRAFGRGCPICNRRETGLRTKKRIIGQIGHLMATHPHLAVQWDHERNAQSPSDYSFGSSAKVWWRCAHGHSWRATIATRSRKATKCPVCLYGGIRTSEAFWKGRLEEVVAFAKRHKRLPRYSRTDHKERKLAGWTKTQLRAKKLGKLSACRVRLLKGAGLWDD